MKPINSRERSKQVWQFIFIFFALAIVPVALIFFSYYRVPEEISEADDQKLVKYSNFDRTQKRIVNKLREVDSNIIVYATSNTENNKRLENEILVGIADLEKIDTSIKMLSFIKKSYGNHFDHVSQLRAAVEKANKCALELQEAKDELKEVQRSSMMGGMGGGIPMPPTEQ